ncbi:hypothetical protein HN51_049786 [Arachis hypogaea]|nr:uncharacterized protein DS421_17g574630 [Arachis hypogaea]
MATYSSRRVVVVFGVGILLVTLMCNMKCSMANKDHEVGVNVKVQHGGCHHGKNSERGEECTSEDDHLGLYADVDDTFKAKHHVKVTHTHNHNHNNHHGKHHQNAEHDSPHSGNNNVHVLGH